MNVTDLFPDLTPERFVDTFRAIADDDEDKHGIAYSGCSPEAIRAYYCELHDTEEDAKAAFDEDMADLIGWTLAELGLTEPEGDQLDWLGDLYEWLEDAGFSWYDATE